METSLEKFARIETRLAIEDLNSDFCYFLDRNNIEQLVELFTPNASYSHGPRVSNGKDEIREIFIGRTDDRVRTSRHMQTGLRITLQSPTEAKGRSVCLTFAADDSPPICPATPFLVADFIDEYLLCDDGKWRIHKRHIERVFTAAENKGPVGLET